MTFKELIASRGISATKLAKVSGVSKTTITSLARGERSFNNIPVENAIKIANTLGLTIEGMVDMMK